MPVLHVLLPLDDESVRQISNEVEDCSTCSSKISVTEKHTEHEALDDRRHCEHSEKQEENKAVSVLHNTTTLQYETHNPSSWCSRFHKY